MLLLALGLVACQGDSTVPTDQTSTDTEPTGETGAPTPTGPTGTPTDTGEPLDCGEPPKGKAAFYSLDFVPDAAHPTVVDARWCQVEAGPVTVEVSFDKGVWEAAPPVDGVVGANRRVVVGIPYGHTAAWRLRSGTEVVDADDPIVIEEAPKGLPIPAITSDPKATVDPAHRYVLTSISEDGGAWGSQGPYHTVIFDRQGRPVWSDAGLTGKRTLYAQVSVTGRTLLYDRFSSPSGSSDAVAIRSYLDGEVERRPIPGHHHAFIELPDGTIAWGARGFGQDEQLMELAPGATKGTVVWDCDTDWKEASTCASNSLYYDAASDMYAFSFYLNETIAFIDRSSGSTLFWAGRLAGGYEFDPPSSQYWWQHGVFITEAGTLMVSTHDQSAGETTNLGREYVIDRPKRTLRRVFEYDAGVLAPFNGDIRRLPDGHTLHSLGTGAVLLEVDEKGADVWRADFTQDGTNNRLLGKSEFIGDLYRLTSSWTEPAR